MDLTTRKSRILITAALFLCFAGAAFGQIATSTGEGLSSRTENSTILREKTEVVTLDVSVTDRQNRAIGGLTRARFDLFEDKVRQQVEFFTTNDNPVSIGIIFDVSSSMQSKLTKARLALKSFIDTSHPEDEYFLVAFNQKPSLIREFTSGDHVLDGLNNLAASGRTAMYDAVYLGLEKLKEARHQRRVLLVISDGEDNSSRFSLQDLKRFVREAGTTIYAISISEAVESTCGRVCQMYARRAMEEISSVTGGRAFFPAYLEDMERLSSQIAIELRSLYSIGYVSTNPVRDGKWRKIVVQLKPDGETRDERPIVRSKDGYFARP